jgi:cytoskeleton protein RodZ
MSELDVKAPGELLKIAREKLGLSINDISLATKINPRILKALENGTKDDLPPKSFTRGFIRSYSSYLKINAEPIIEAYNLAEHVHVPEPGDLEKVKTEVAAPNKQVISNRSKTLTISGVVVLILIVIGVKQIFDKYSREADVEENPIIKTEPISAPEPNKIADAQTTTTSENPAVLPTETSSSTQPAETVATAAETKTETPKIETQIKTETQAPAAAPAAEALVAVKPKVEAPVTAPVATLPVVTPPVIKPVAIPPTKPVATVPTTTPAPTSAAAPAIPAAVAAKPVVATEPAKTTPVIAEKKSEAANAGVVQEVMVEALDKVDLVIKTNEGTKKIQLQPEGIHTIKFNGKMSLEISDGGTVNLIHNGRDKGIPGDLGKAKTVQFP